MMRRWIAVASIAALAGAAHADGTALLDYHRGTAYLPQTPSVTGGGAGAFSNPAAWATTTGGEADFWWDDRNVKEDHLDNWGFSLGRNVGFAMRRNLYGMEGDTYRVDDYQFGFSGGDRRAFAGVAFRWSGGESGRLGRENSVVLGSIHRPNRYVSFGLAGDFSTHSDARLGVFDAGLRPFGRPWVTLFGDYSLTEKDDFDAGRWGAGAEIRPWRGIHLGVKVREADDFSGDDYEYSLNLGLTIDGMGVHVLPGYDEDGDRGVTTYLVRTEPPYRGLPVARALRRWFDKPRYVPVNLENKAIRYQKARWFEDDRVAWIDLAEELDRIRQDETVGGVAFNLAGTDLSPSIAWELRRKMDDLRAAGKEVLAYVDNASNLNYYVVSGADRITLDPEGMLLVPGLAAHRTYMRGLFDKLGVGVEEWRFFTYKSAFEGFTRKEMSDADREQIGRAIDVIYETMRAGVCETRKMTPARFDALVDSQAIFTPERALEAGLVDTLARWDAFGDWVEANRDGASYGRREYDRDDGVFYDETWGRPKEVALVYAIGECAMDTGIRGRATSKHMRDLAKDKDVAAVVLRADSPGGDALASDLVAEATTKLKEAKKPVVISQGDVAGSGGYWISMCGSKIYTTPVTITGSIGVIGGWFWDDGVGDKTGFTADGVQRGTHADLFTGIRFPVLGRLPERNLNDEEKRGIHDMFLEFYGGFVGKVAANRNLSDEAVRKIAEGRIWMGRDAIDRGLVDSVGTFQDAIAEAKRLAGIAPSEEVILTEYPPRPFFRFPEFGGGPLGLLLSPVASRLGLAPAAPGERSSSYDEIYLKSLVESPGKPLVLTPPELLPDEYVESR